MRLLEVLGIDLPIIQAPMAGVSSPLMAAAVANAGALGSIGVGATDAAGAQRMIETVRRHSQRAFNVNVFCHQPAREDPEVDQGWIAHLRPYFAQFGAQPPERLAEIYRSFLTDDDMLALLLRMQPKVVSFHFGLPAAERIRALRAAGIVLLASATNLAEARAAAAAGVQAIVAQGYEAGGHRGLFDPAGPDDALSTSVLTRLLVREIPLPVIAAGGIMDGAGIAAALRLGASAAQLGTAFIPCRESDADAFYRQALASGAAQHTVMTRAISGRPARCLGNAFTALGAQVAPQRVPSYPLAYAVGKALNLAAKSAGNGGFGAQWAGQGAPLARHGLTAQELVALLAEELRAARG